MRNRVALFLAALPACSLFSSLDDLSETVVYVEAGADGPDGTSGGDGSGANGGDTGSGSDGNMQIVDAGDDSGYPNLHPNGTFDVGCQGWFPYNATLAADSTAHSGAGSCRVCSTVTSSDVATIDEAGVLVPVANGGVYVASAWFRVPDGVSGPSSGVKITLVTRAQGGADLDTQQGSLSAIDATSWTQLKVQLTATQDAAKLRVWAGGKAQTSACFLIDDLRVERWQ